MMKDTTVIRFRQPDAIDDPLTALAREGARRMLAQALIAEADAFVALWKDLKLPDGRDRVVRHGHGPHTRDPDRRRACRGSSRQGPRPGRRRRGGEDPMTAFEIFQRCREHGALGPKLGLLAHPLRRILI